MSDPSGAPQAQPSARGGLRRYLVVGAVLALVVGLAAWRLYPWFQTRQHIRGLGSSDEAMAARHEAALVSSTDPDLDERLAAAVSDGDLAYSARLRCVSLLLRRQRVMLVERLGRSDDLLTRGIVLRRLIQEKGYFQSSVLPDPGFRVEATVLGWLADPKAPRRYHAIQLALELELASAMEPIRALLTRAGAEGAGRQDANLTLIAAAEAVVRFRDCASAERVAVLAESDPDLDVRLRTLEHLERLAVGLGGGEPVCPDPRLAERVAGVVTRSLDAEGPPEFARSLRVKGLSMIQRHTEWLPANLERVRAILDGPGNGAERRAALGALVHGKDPRLSERYARYVHDPEFEVRDEAIIQSNVVEGLAVPASLWIGSLSDETRSLQSLDQAHLRLKQLAGVEVGLPEALVRLQATQPAQIGRAVDTFIEEQFRRGESQGVTREAWGEAWFRWLAGEQGLEGAALEAAVGARRAFRRAADLQDVAAARAALEAAGLYASPLFLYERGWLEARAP